MKNNLLVLIVFLLFSCQESESPDSTPQNGIEIGSQIWMKENLKVKTFRNGDQITESKSVEDWIRLYDEKKPAWTVYLWEENSERLYGVIYNYYAMIDPRGLAPEDWRIPTSTDFFNLIEFNGGSINAPNKIMSEELWVENAGNNESGFNATPGSEIWAGGTFGYRNEYVSFWTSSLSVSGNQIFLGINCKPNREIYFNEDHSLNTVLENRAGLYIRCIRE